jgi:hypothetical protein
LNWQFRAKGVFGSTYPLAKHLAEITAMFVMLLLCLFIVRHAIPFFFSTSEDLGRVLHIIDTYASLLGIIGYSIWVTLDFLAILIHRARVFAKTFKKGVGK